MRNSIRIHRPDGLHGWGIEYNYGLEVSFDGEAADFVRLCRTRLDHHWFYQSGSDTPDKGYQFFEYWGTDPDTTVRRAAKDIARELGCAVEG